MPDFHFSSIGQSDRVYKTSHAQESKAGPLRLRSAAHRIFLQKKETISYYLLPVAGQFSNSPDRHLEMQKP